MSSAAAENANGRNFELLKDLEICLTCFGLRGQYLDKEHRCDCTPRDDNWRQQEWSRYDIAALIDICSLCARGTMKSGSRYTWLVCDQCRSVNTRIGQVFDGSGKGALPVGRHSIMNQISLGGGNIDDEAIKEFSSWLFGLTKVWSRLFDWRLEEARRLVTDAGFQEPAVPLPMWLDRFPGSVGASVDAFCRYVGYDLPGHRSLKGLSEARTRFLNSPNK